jgi:hypothetical protein
MKKIIKFQKVILFSIKWVFGYRKRWCIECHKVTEHIHHTLVGWNCQKCNTSDYIRQSFKKSS